MSGVPRSQRLIAHFSTESIQSAAFVCPDNHVTLVKFATVWNNAATDRVCQVTMIKAGATFGIVLVHEQLVADQIVNLECWQVLHPGDYIYTEASGDNVRSWVSGAVLVGGPYFPSAEDAETPFFPPGPVQLPRGA